MEVEFNPQSHEWKPDPYTKYRELRDHAPVHYSPEADLWVISRHADVQHVLTSTSEFSSKTQMRRQRGQIDELNAFQKVKAMVGMLRRLRVTPWQAARSRMLIGEDGDVHAVMRKIVNKGFTPRRVHAWDDRIAELVDGCMQKIRGREHFDLVEELAVPLPVTVIAEWIGVEPELQHTFKRWSDAIIQGGTGSGQQFSGSPDNPVWTAIAELRTYLRPIVAERRANPTDDLISLLVQAEGEAELSDYEIFMFVLLLLIAGNETTTNLLGNGVDALLAHPEQLDRVVADPELIPGLVEEVLRFDAPVQFITRVTTAEVELAGATIPKDAFVAVLLGSANRDERFWEDPDRFDITRQTSGHVGFGFGKHFCLGASLARLEAEAGFRGLLPELPKLVRSKPDPEFLDSYLIRGRARLDLERAA
jgi:cytochrome P450